MINTTHSTIKTKPVDTKLITYIDFDVENNEKDPRFKVGHHGRISKYKIIFAKGYKRVWSEILVIKKVENIVP